MMPWLMEAPPKGDEWQHEIKYDGYRTELVIDGSRARAMGLEGIVSKRKKSRYRSGASNRG